jgi:hypothetical protein
VLHIVVHAVNHVRLRHRQLGSRSY